MAGYSGTALPKKLGIVDGSWVVLVNPAHGFDATLGQLPDNVTIAKTAKSADVVVVFVKQRRHRARTVPPRGLVDVKVCAIDDIWSGLKLVWRKELRTS